MRFIEPLPIDAVLDEIRTALITSASAVLVAPPGAGKTTRVPLALFDEAWAKGRKIIILEPRRLAARAAAARMAATLVEPVGETIGVRARLATKSGPKTRIEVVTEGVFTRMILDDPGLDHVAAVIFDEFHERSLDADFGLALALDCQRGLRPDLKILVMSATLDGARVARLLGDGVPLIQSEGRAFPVTTHYLGRDVQTRLEDQVTAAVQKALKAETGSLLVFLPGQGEIRRVEERLNERVTDRAVVVAPLYGAMDIAAQDQAVLPAKSGERKIVLATSIAETSLTIEGVRVVIDCGLSRVPRYEPGVGVTRLETVRVSRASADQRRGRAGRTEPGVCYRLWDEPQNLSLAPFSEPEIKAAGLSGLVLDCAEWGVADPATLSWLDPPPAAALDAAREELTTLGALDTGNRITPLGRKIRELPLPPRLAAMVLKAGEMGCASAAAEIAAVLVERGLGGNDTDLTHRLVEFRRDRSWRAEDMSRLAEGWARAAGGARSKTPAEPAVLLALAFPDRLAKARGTLAPGQYLLANGRAGTLDVKDPLARAPYLAVAELSGTAAAARILLAAPLDERSFLEIAGNRITARDEVVFDVEAAAVRGRFVRRLDQIVMASEPRAVAAGPESAERLADGIAGLGISRLPWSKAQVQLKDRVAFLRAAEGGSWPDFSDGALAATAPDWLAPFLMGKTRLAEINADDLGQALAALIPWDLQRRLDADAPTHFDAPTGNRHPIEYEGPGAPALRIRVQELFGLKVHPAIAHGKLPLTLYLLSPAHREIQITRDLPGFWAGSWAAVKADMRGQYPKHVWPDDPANAAPTARAKPRGT